MKRLIFTRVVIVDMELVWRHYCLVTHSFFFWTNTIPWTVLHRENWVEQEKQDLRGIFSPRDQHVQYTKAIYMYFWESWVVQCAGTKAMAGKNHKDRTQEGWEGPYNVGPRKSSQARKSRINPRGTSNHQMGFVLLSFPLTVEGYNQLCILKFLLRSQDEGWFSGNRTQDKENS